MSPTSLVDLRAPELKAAGPSRIPWQQENGLRVPEVDPLLAYLASTQALAEAAKDECAVLLGRELDEHGVIEIAKDSGLFVGIRD